MSSFNSPSRALSRLQIKFISCELQNISGNTVIQIKSAIFINITINITFIIIIIIAFVTRRPRLHSHQSDAPQYIKTLDSTAVDPHCNVSPVHLTRTEAREKGQASCSVMTLRLMRSRCCPCVCVPPNA
jgi:hypothetical protein